MDTPATNLDPVTVEKKLRLASDLYTFALETKKFQLRQKFPELSDEELTQRAAELIERGTR